MYYTLVSQLITPYLIGYRIKPIDTGYLINLIYHNYIIDVNFNNYGCTNMFINNVDINCIKKSLFNFYNLINNSITIRNIDNLSDISIILTNVDDITHFTILRLKIRYVFKIISKFTSEDMSYLLSYIID